MLIIALMLNKLQTIERKYIQTDMPPKVGLKINKEVCMKFSREEKRKMVESIISKMESFFSTLKKAIWFGRDKEYKSPTELIAAIDGYIDWYNNKRIQHGLKGMPPLQCRRSLAILKVA